VADFLWRALRPKTCAEQNVVFWFIH
jgi:hypothetical protein